MKTYSQPKKGGSPISSRQIKTIHTLISVLKMSDEEYRYLLWERYQVQSSKALSWGQAENLIEDLQKKTGKEAPRPQRKAKPYADLDGRPGMASGAQCRLIAAMWGEVSRAETPEARQQALDKFVKRIVGVDALRFVKGWQVEKIVKAIEVMKKTKEEGSTC